MLQEIVSFLLNTRFLLPLTTKNYFTQDQMIRIFNVRTLKRSYSIKAAFHILEQYQILSLKSIYQMFNLCMKIFTVIISPN